MGKAHGGFKIPAWNKVYACPLQHLPLMSYTADDFSLQSENVSLTSEYIHALRYSSAVATMRI